MHDSYGVLQREITNSEVERAVEEIKLVGFSTIDSGLSLEKIQKLKEICEATAVTYKEKYAKFKLEESGESNNHRAPLLENSIFLDIAENENVLAVVSNLIVGGFYLNQQNLVVNPPSSAHYNQLKFHRDLPYQHYVSTRPIAVNALLAIDNFTVENGATIAIPGSHKVEKFSSDVVIDRQSKQVEVKAGTFLLLDCMTYHAAGSNKSKFNRIGVNHVYSTLMLRPQIDWNRALSESQIQSLSPSQNQLLGLNQKIAGSVEDFLTHRMKK